MDMNKTSFVKKETHKPNWRLIDATDKVVGRLATEIADALRGKDKTCYTSYMDSGDYIVVINADKLVFTGDKMADKEYVWYTQHIGGYKSLTAKEMAKKHPTYILMHAVKGMLGSTKLARAQLKKLRIYMGAEHDHTAQFAPKKVKVAKTKPESKTAKTKIINEKSQPEVKTQTPKIKVSSTEKNSYKK